MTKKLASISELTSNKKFALVKLKNGEELICREDCNGWEEDNTPNLLVDVYSPSLVRYYSEILIDDDIESVEEFKTKK